jgi:hypothetical protein
MPKKVLQSQVPQVLSSEKQEASPGYELQMCWRMRWFWAILLASLSVISTAGGFIGFLLTRNPSLLALVVVSKTLLLAIYYLIPLDEKRYQLKALKILAKAATRREKFRN